MKTVIEMAREAGFKLVCTHPNEYELYGAFPNELERFAALVREDEREKQQEPVAVYAFRRKGLDDFCTCDERRYLELSEKPHLFETAIFYTTPPTAALAAKQMRDACISILHNLDMGSAYQLSLGQRMRLREAMEALPILGEDK